MGAPTWPPNPHTLGAPRRSRAAPRLPAAEEDFGDAVARPALDDERLAPEQAQHPGIGGEYIGPEGVDAALFGSAQKLGRQQGAEPQALPAILHHEGDVRGGGLVRDQRIPGDGNEDRFLLIVAFGHEGEPPTVVDGREHPRPGRRKRSHGREEPLIHRLEAQPREQGLESDVVVGPDGTDAHARAIAERGHGLRLTGIYQR